MISLALALLTSLVAQGNRWFRLTAARNLAQQQQLSLGTRLTQDLRQSLLSCIQAAYPAAATTDLAIGFPTAYDADARYQVDPISREPMFQSYEIFYRKPVDNTLRVLRSPLGASFPLLNPLRPPTAELLSAVATPGQTIARYVTTFTLTDAAGAATTTISDPLTFLVRVETAVEGSQEKKILEVTSTVHLPR